MSNVTAGGDRGVGYPGRDSAADAEADEAVAARAGAAEPVRRKHPVLRVLVVLVLIGGYFLYLPVAAVLLWSSARVWGVTAFVAAFAALVGPAFVLAAALRKRVWPSWASILFAVASTAAGALCLIWVMGVTAPPTNVLAARLDEVGVPPNWVLVDEHVSAGSNCFDVCPSVCRRYRPTDSVDTAVESSSIWFSRSGYSMVRADWSRRPVLEGRGWHHVLTVQNSSRSIPPDYRTREDLVEVCLSGREVP